MENLTEVEIAKIFSNPFYCLPRVDYSFMTEHQTLVTEEMWIKCGVNLIKEIGAEQYLKYLLENLKGNYTKNK